MARPRSEAARAKMLDAATDLVLERGVHGFSIDEIARRSGVAKTTIYRHFPDTNDLLATAVDRTVTYPETPDTGTLRGDLVALLRGILPNFADPKARAVHFELFAALTRDEDLVRANKKLTRSRSSPLANIFRRWQDKGEISADLDVDTAFEIIDGPFVTRSILRPHSLEHVDFDALVDRILVQLAPDGST